MSKAVVYSKEFCPYCVAAFRLLAQKGVEVEKIDGMLNSHEMLSALVAEGATTKTFPQIWLDGVYIGGYDHLRAFYNDTK